jgi:aromatic ring-cleaving dioxygenase
VGVFRNVMLLLLLLLLLPLLDGRAAAAAKPPPAISERFSTRTVEVDDTAAGHPVTLRQVLAIDPVVGRSLMRAEGALTRGHLVQIKRCDLGPASFFLDIAGPPNSSAAAWRCTNMSIPDPQASCQWSPFFPALPENRTYEGVVACPVGRRRGGGGQDDDRRPLGNVNCDKWTYWDGNEKWGWWTLEDQPIPVRLAKLVKDPAHPTWHLWHLEFEDFLAGEPPVSEFAPPTGLGPCQPAPPRKNTETLSNTVMLPLLGGRAPLMLPAQLGADNKSCRATDVPLQSYHIHVLFDAANNSNVREALQLQVDFMHAFDLSGKPNCTVVAGDPAPWIKDICSFEIDWEPAGPFLSAQYSWFVPVEKLTKAVAWTVRHKGDLDVLVHPNSGCEVEDHTSWAMWGGNKNPIDTSIFSCEYPGCVPPASA